jgi:hypothetical protein
MVLYIMEEYLVELNIIQEYFGMAINNLDGTELFAYSINTQGKIHAYYTVYQVCTEAVDIENADYGAIYCYNLYKNNMILYCKTISSRLEYFPISKICFYYNKFKCLYKWLYSIFCYIDRHYVKHNDLLNIKSELANHLFCEIIIEKNIEIILNEIKFIIFRYRNYKNGNLEQLLKSETLPIIVELLEICNQIYSDSNTIFHKEFTNLIYNESIEYYRSFKQNLLYDGFSSSKYVNMLKEIYENETTMLLKLNTYDNYLLEQCLEQFKIIFYEEEYNNIIDNKIDGIHILIQNNKIEEIKLIYNVLSFNNNILEYIGKVFSEYFFESIYELFIEFNTINFVSFIHKIEKINNLTNICFNNDAIIYNAIKDKIRLIINYKKEKFINLLVDNFGINIIINTFLIDLIDEKDYFFNLYLSKLETKLLNETYNMEQEEEILKILEPNYKNNYINKLKIMLKDIKNTKIFNLELSNNILNNYTDNYYIKILTTGNWSFNFEKNKEINLPPDMIKYQYIVEEYYKLKNNNRQLNVNHNLGEIVLQFDENLEIKTIPLIGIVLLQFNDYDSLSLEELLEKTNMERDILINCLFSILNCEIKILIKYSIDSTIDPLIVNDSDIFLLNSIKLTESTSINIKMKNIKTKEIKIEKEIDNFKKYRTEACIVHFMKQKKNIDHKMLINIVFKKMKSWGSSIELIEKCIKNLIEKEYIDQEEEYYIYCP